jgi:hypothetical protein
VPKLLGLAAILAAGMAVPVAAPAATSPRLAGDFAVSLVSQTRGGKPTDGYRGVAGKWRFSPVCKRGPCNVKWADLESDHFRFPPKDVPGDARSPLTRSGNVYTSTRPYNYCHDFGYPARKLRVTVTGSVVRKKRRIVSRFTAIETVPVRDEETGEMVDEVTRYTGRFPRAGENIPLPYAGCNELSG